MALLADPVLDNGLSELDAVDELHICSAEPTDYTDALSKSLGLKVVGTGFFGAPEAGSPGRISTSDAITGGEVTTNGTATHWAALDTVASPSRLLATGELSAPMSVTDGQSFNLAAITIHATNLSVWSPSDVQGLLAWYDANVGVYSDAGVTPAVLNDDVVQWNDISGNGYNISHVSGTQRFITSSTELNNKVVVALTTVGNIMSTAADVVATEGTDVYSMFIVGNISPSTPNGGSYGTFLAKGQANIWDNIYSAYLSRQVDATDRWEVQSNGAGGTYTSTITSTPIRFGMVFDGVNSTVYVNNVAGTSVADTINLGGPTDNLGTLSPCGGWTGVVGEMVYFTAALDSDQRAALDAYFVEKWGF